MVSGNRKCVNIFKRRKSSYLIILINAIWSNFSETIVMTTNILSKTISGNAAAGIKGTVSTGGGVGFPKLYVIFWWPLFLANKFTFLSDPSPIIGNACQ